MILGLQRIFWPELDIKRYDLCRSFAWRKRCLSGSASKNNLCETTHAKNCDKSKRSAKVDGPGIKNRKAKIGWSKRKRDEIERSSGMREDRSKSLKWPFYIFSRRHSHFDWFGPFTCGRMSVNIDSSSGTVHFRPANDRPIWLKPLSFEQLIHFHPFWPAHFRTDLWTLSLCYFEANKRVIPVVH